MKTPPADLAQRLLDTSEHVLYGDPPPRLEDVARLVGASRATMYYYFAGREDLVAFLLTTHTRDAAQSVRSAVNEDDEPEPRLRAMVHAMVTYLGEHPGICAGLLGALGDTGRMSEALQANDLWIATPLREVLREGRKAGVFAIDDVTDAANAILGAILLGVLGRSALGANPTDATFRRRLTEQAVRGVLSA